MVVYDINDMHVVNYIIKKTISRKNIILNKGHKKALNLKHYNKKI